MVGFDVKVRSTETFLYGGEGVEIVLDSRLYLLCRVDGFGEVIEISVVNGTEVTFIGRIKPGEAVIVPLSNVTGVVAQTVVGDVDSDVRCTILGATDT